MAITVTTLSDSVDAGDGVLSLREALMLANGNAESDNITFAAALAGGTLVLANGELTVTTDGVTIDGDVDGNGTADIVISGNNASRVFRIDDGAATTITAALNGLVVQDGNATGVDLAGYGGGIHVGTADALTLRNVTVSGCSATYGGGGVFGDDNAAITLDNATVSGNTAGYDGGGIYGDFGAAITLTNVTVSGNTAGANGGGIYGFSDNPIRLINSTVTGNSAGANGGGIYNFGVDSLTTLTNSIVAGNAAASTGDDLYGDYFADLVFTGSNIIGSDPENFDTVTGAATAQIDGANQVDLETVFAAVALDPNTNVLSGVLGNNDTPVSTVAIQTGGIAHNSGSDIALPADTRDLDGDGNTAEALPIDARGFARIVGTVDIGAVELQAAPAALVVTTLDDEVFEGGDVLSETRDGAGLSLREALGLANGDPADANTITFAPALAGGTLFLTSGQELAITTDGITIDGDIDHNGTPDITIDADSGAGLSDATSRVFVIDDGTPFESTTITAALNGLIIRDGRSSSSGGGIRIFGGDALILSNSIVVDNRANNGGGIYGRLDSALTLINSTVAGNSAGFVGGGIYLHGAVTVIGSTVSGNSSNLVGGGIAGYRTSIALADSTVSDNDAAWLGGGIFIGSSSEVALSNSTVSGNRSAYGGGIFSGVGTEITMTNATVSGNRASTDGGAIFAADGALRLINATVSGNSAGRDGGGVYHTGGDVITLSNSVVAGNAAAGVGDDLVAGQLPSSLVFAGGNIIGSDPENFTTTIGAPSAPIDGTDQAALATVFAGVAPDPHTSVLSGVLADNGGPVGTIALRPGGVAHNGGDNGALPADTADLDGDGDVIEPLPLDARGLSRSFGARSDIGAFEIQLSQIGDLDGDFHTDVLWRENTGIVALWQMDGVSVFANNFVAAIPDHWDVVDADSDFDGDGRSDILWQDDAGVVVLWTMGGPSILSNTPVAVPIPDHWDIADTGDFTGDGRADVLWRETTGRVVLWEMNGATVVRNTLVAVVPATSQIQDTADFTGDGVNDILWRDDDGSIRIWEMNGASVISDTTIATLPDYWQFAATGDFNGDATYDLLWRDTTGVVVMWEMAGGGIIGNTAIGTVPDDWFVPDTGDYTGDLNHDILWRDEDGTIVLWEMDGPTIVDDTAINTIPTHWHIV
jgi:predicted outer membrane repeat protein